MIERNFVSIEIISSQYFRRRPGGHWHVLWFCSLSAYLGELNKNERFTKCNYLNNNFASERSVLLVKIFLQNISEEKKNVILRFYSECDAIYKVESDECNYV